ncbi:hypothetical protein RN001_013271 [Aquatica leii]|uniref:Reverse transcriptase n=1 Tax=Aquatica leii TaxID=1421715 RepID=A0AAN7P274_9COLE|nr:hypothetical protein RN001_013271 [Aquatica leii]
MADNDNLEKAYDSVPLKSMFNILTKVGLKKDKRKINAVEMDYLRPSCRISRQEHIQNEQIRRRTRRVHTTVERVETRQLVWYGHVKRMSDDRWPKRALEYIPPSRRRRGRPAQTWMSGIVDTMRDRAIQENEWENRKVWRAKCEMRQKP